jgi:hypothetical protein
MRAKDELLRCFTPAELSPKFSALLDQYFDESVLLCTGCELHADTDHSLKLFFPNAAQFTAHQHRFVIFGQATHSGSEYAFFKPEYPAVMDDWAVVVLGDEGGALALARNFDDFLRFLTLNVEPYIGAQVSPDGISPGFDLTPYEEDEDEGDEWSNTDYVAWLQQEYALEKLATIAQARQEIIAPAQEQHQAELDCIMAF